MSTDTNGVWEGHAQVDVLVEVSGRDPMNSRGADDPDGMLPRTGGEALMVALPALALLLVRYIVNAVRRRSASWEAT